MFTQPVSMKCTYEQYTNDLVPHLLNMGYKKFDISSFLACPYICTNYSGVDYYLTNLASDNIHNNGRYFIKEYNRDFFLALASIRSDNEIKVGDWVINPNCENPTPSKIIEIQKDYYKTPETLTNPLILGFARKNSSIRKATAREIIKHFSMQNRFPFKLNLVDARKIIDSACNSWKERLLQDWNKELILKDFVMIEETFYKEMRNECTSNQHRLFDEIFGKDFKIGDWVYVINGGNGAFGANDFIGQITDRKTAQEKGYKGYSTLHKEDAPLYVTNGITSWGLCKGYEIRKATQEEINKVENPCPYKKGELIFIKLQGSDIWHVRYATGRMLNELVEVYVNQLKESSSVTLSNKHAKLGDTLPD